MFHINVLISIDTFCLYHMILIFLFWKNKNLSQSNFNLKFKNESLWNIKREGAPTFCDSMDGIGEHYAKWNKPGSERQIPYDLIYKWNLMNKTNKQAKYNQKNLNKEQTESNQKGSRRGPRGPRTYTDPLIWKSAPAKGQSAFENQRKWLNMGWELSKQHCSLSDPFPTYSVTMQRRGLRCSTP